jgi:hypothetical protein
MKVRMLRQPVGSVNGVNLTLYKPHLVYDLPSSLAGYLVTTGFARLEMRASTTPEPPLGIERRKRAVQARDGASSS